MTIRSNAVTDLVRRSAARQPDAPALTFRDRTWTYRELIGAAERAATALVARGLVPGDRVLFLGRNSDQYVIGWLATTMAGGIHVPVNFMLTAAEVAFIVEHSEPTCAFADRDLFEVLDTAVRMTQCTATIGVIGDGLPDDLGDERRDLSDVGRLSDLWAADPDPSIEVPAPADDDDIAQIAYTSGTESAPKGVMLSHRALVAQYMSCIVEGGYERTDVVLNSLPLYHCAQLHCFLMPHLALGTHNVLLSSADPGAMFDAIARHGVTSIFAPPTVWIGLLRHDRFTTESMSTITKGYYGASIMPTAVVEELARRQPRTRLWNYYGQTEIAPLATVLGPDEQLTRPGSAGRPVLNVETRVVDDAMADVAPGETGEVVHRSPQLLTGYYRRPDLTEAACAGGWFHSGDLATRDADGYITIVDRKKDMINSGGENVSSREVEEVLYQFDGVAEVAVVGVPDDKWIEAVCAVVVPRAGAEIDAAALIGHARDRLAPFKVPKSVVVVGELPKNPSGKVLKRELREQVKNP